MTDNRASFVDETSHSSVLVGRISIEGRNNKTTPERRCNAIARGPRRYTKGRNRLMAIVPQSADIPPPPVQTTLEGVAA